MHTVHQNEINTTLKEELPLKSNLPELFFFFFLLLPRCSVTPRISFLHSNKNRSGKKSVYMLSYTYIIISYKFCHLKKCLPIRPPVTTVPEVQSPVSQGSWYSTTCSPPLGHHDERMQLSIRHFFPKWRNTILHLPAMDNLSETVSAVSEKQSRER